LACDRGRSICFGFGDEVSTFCGIAQKRVDALMDAFDIEAALLGFQGHARVEVGDDGGVGEFSFANFRFNGCMVGTAERQSILLFRAGFWAYPSPMDEDEPIQMPIDGVLDLHTFKPREVHVLVKDYLAACVERGIFHVRIIHGKGTGALRETVHSILAKNPAVEEFSLDHPEYGGWGATIVKLRKV
jgi:Smr domain